MRRRSLLLLVSFLLVVLCAVAVAAPDALRQQGMARPAAETGVVVVPDHFLRRWDPVTVFFPGDRGPAAGGPEDDPDRLVRLEPAHPGAWSWLDARTLQFRPADPWPALARVALEVDDRRVELRTLAAAPVRTEPEDGAEDLDPVGSLTLAFAEPLAPEALARMVTLEVRAQDGGAAPRVLDRADFTVKALDRASTSAEAIYVLTLDEDIPLGRDVTLRVGLHLKTHGEEEPTGARVRFSTAAPFRVEALGCPEHRLPVTPEGTRYAVEQQLRCDRGGAVVQVDFSAEPQTLDPLQARDLVRFEPSVEGLSYELQGRRLRVRGAFEPERVYAVRVAPAPVVDRRGRLLDLRGESTVHLVFPARAPYLRVGAGDLLLERKGPQTVPLEARGHGQVDLRIHPVDPLDRSFWPFPADPVAVSEDERPPGPGEEPEPFTAADGAVTRGDLARHLRTLGAPPVSVAVDLPEEAQAGAAAFSLDLAPHLQRLAGRRAAGTYLVGLRTLDGSPVRSWVRVQVTDLALSAVEGTDTVRFLVTSLSTGRPVTGATVTVEGALQRRGEAASWATLARGRTGPDGTFAWAAPGAEPGLHRRTHRVVVQAEDDVLVLDPNRPPDRFADNLWRSGGGGWLQWPFENLEGRGAPDEHLCHLFPERPVYRPGEPVHLKGMVRIRARGRLAPRTGEGTVVVAGPGDQAWRLPVDLSSQGSFYVSFQEDDAPTGAYVAWFEDPQGRRLGTAEFRMEDYRVPRFEVRLDAQPRVPLDRPFGVKLTASYHAGGKVSGSPVRWRVTQYPLTFSPPGLDGFLLSSDGRYSRTGTFEATPRLERDTTTGPDGTDELVLDPTAEALAMPRVYVVEATVTGDDDQTVTSTERVEAVPPFLLGVQVDRYLEGVDAVAPRVVAVSPAGTLLAGQEVTVRLLHRQWHSRLQAGPFDDGAARYLTDVVDVPVSETTIRTAEAPVPVRLPVPEAGVYVVELEARDAVGRAQTLAVDLYAGGEEAVTWDRPAAGVFTLATDQAAYDPGQTAAVVLQSPFQEARALVVVEAPEGNRYHQLDVRRGTATFRLPIEATWVPRVPVHVVLMRGRVAEPTGSDMDLGRPATVAATAWVQVNPVEHRVEVTLLHPERARPGEEIPVTLRLADPRGRPLAGEVTLWLVDQAVLSLGREARLDPLPDFLTPVVSRVAVADTRNRVQGRLPLQVMPGGDGGGDEEGDPLDRATVRKDFQPVPVYLPSVQVGPGGVATVKVKLPDNLTTFRVRAKATAGAERFGVATGSVAVRLPVLVEPALPRFARPGDHFQGAAIARVVEGAGGPGTFSVALDGAASGPRQTQAMTLDPTASRRVRFPVDVTTPVLDRSGLTRSAELVVRAGVSRAADGAADAFEVRLPVRDDRRPVHVRTLATVTPETPLDVAALPEPARPGTVHRVVRVATEPGLLRMVAGLDAIVRYPYGCTEQRISRARVLVGLRGMQRLLGTGVDDGDLDRAVAETVAWIGGAVDRHGLVAYWPGSEGNVWLTAWTVLFLVDAGDAGYRVDDALLADLTRALQASLRSDYGRFVDGAAWLERAWALAALSAAGRFDDAYFSELARKASYLDAEGMAQVVLAGARAGQQDAPAMKTLLGRLAGTVATRLHMGREIYAGLQGQRPVRSHLVLAGEVRTLAEVTRALARAAPDHPRLPLLREALVTTGSDGGWGSPNADAAALLALADHLRDTRDGNPGGDPRTVRIHAGGQAHVLTLGPGAPLASWTGDDPGDLRIEVTGGAVDLWVDSGFVPADPGALQPARAHGFVVARTLLRGVGSGAPPDRLELAERGSTLAFRVGDVVEEVVRVVNPEDRAHVAVVVPLAAGFEALNPALRTAPPEATPSAPPTLPPTWTDTRDDHVAFYYNQLPKGTYEVRFRTRATTAGRFVQPPALAAHMYDAAVEGQSPGAWVEVAE